MGDSSLPRNLPRRYQVKEIIGTGSYGKVVSALDRKTRKMVAIKCISKIYHDLVDCRRIIREVSILNRLRHSLIINLIDIVYDSVHEDLFLVMNLMQCDLRKLIRQTEVEVTDIHVRTLMYNLLLALHVMHSKGIIHRDIKPANVLLNRDCSLQVCDFGLSRVGLEMNKSDKGTKHGHQKENKEPSVDKRMDSRLVKSNSKSVLSKQTQHVVTRWYRAPEVILLNKNYGAEIDTWSAGCIMAELIQMTAPEPYKRSPLFPGKSCYPLSPRREGQPEHYDQLKVIISVLGTPSNEVLSTYDEETRNYIQRLGYHRGIEMDKRYDYTSVEARELLKRMLAFNSKDRIGLEEALDHKWFDPVRPNNQFVRVDQTKITIPIDVKFPGKATKGQLEEMLYKEIDLFKGNTSPMSWRQRLVRCLDSKKKTTDIS